MATAGATTLFRRIGSRGCLEELSDRFKGSAVSESDSVAASAARE